MAESKDRPAIPVVGDVIGRGAIEGLIAARPTTAPYVQTGRYGDVITGWRGQFETARKRLVDEFVASRLKTARGPALTDIAVGQYDTPRLVGDRFAIGEAVCARKVVHFADDSLDTILQADATDEGSHELLLSAIKTAMIGGFAIVGGVVTNTFVPGHQNYVYSSTTGVGSHGVADPQAWPVLSFSTMTQLVSQANNIKALVNAHVNTTVILNGAVHKDADTANAIPTPDAFVELKSGASDLFTGATPASQQSLLRVVNAAKVALNAHFAVESIAGVIRQGHLFSVEADPTATPPVFAADFEASEDTALGTGIQSATVKIRATKPGTSSNQPILTPAATRTLRSRSVFFDSGLSVPDIRAAGGATEQIDDELVRASQARWKGSNAPTNDALLAGSLGDAGASRTVVREDTATGHALVYPVDQSWAQSDTWRGYVGQRMATKWQGFGCAVDVGQVVNRLIKLELTVVLTDAKYLSDTRDIQAAIVKKSRSYFDDRPDWYVWRLSSIRGVVARADRRILTCSLAVVKSAGGIPLSETSAIATVGAILTHYWLPDNAISVNFTAPV